MRNDLEKALADEFPFMRRGLSAKEQEERQGVIRDLLGAFGVEAGDGWYDLIRNMCAEIAAAYEAEGRPVDIVVDQVKEKFGTLRFYYHHADRSAAIPGPDGLDGGHVRRRRPGDDALQRNISDIVAKYAERSARVCEICGKPGSLRTDQPGVQTLCMEHDQERRAKRERRKKDEPPKPK